MTNHDQPSAGQDASPMPLSQPDAPYSKPPQETQTPAPALRWRRHPHHGIPIVAIAIAIALMAVIALVMFATTSDEEPEPTTETATWLVPQGNTADIAAVLQSKSVSTEDLLTAKEAGAPESVISELKQGKWPDENDKLFVRKAEIATTAMSQQYGMRFHPAENSYGPALGIRYDTDQPVTIPTFAVSNDGTQIPITVTVAFDGENLRISNDYEQASTADHEQDTEPSEETID